MTSIHNTGTRRAVGVLNRTPAEGTRTRVHSIEWPTALPGGGGPVTVSPRRSTRRTRPKEAGPPRSQPNWTTQDELAEAEAEAEAEETEIVEAPEPSRSERSQI
jgi:hypothetical protein